MFLRIVHYTDARIADPRGQMPLPWREFQGARNSILQVFREFGTIGPMDLCPLDAALSDEQITKEWKSSPVAVPDFFVLDNQLNDERYVYVEIGKASVLTSAWLERLAAQLETMPGWGVGITNLRDGYLLILGSTQLVTGKSFGRMNDVNSLLAACRDTVV